MADDGGGGVARSKPFVYRVCLHGADEAGKSKIMMVQTTGGYDDSYSPSEFFCWCIVCVERNETCFCLGLC
jgi:hypothetical protein